MCNSRQFVHRQNILRVTIYRTLHIGARKQRMPLYVQTFLLHCYPTLEVKLVKFTLLKETANLPRFGEFFMGASPVKLANWF